jgi:hypothetical protein
MPTRRPKPASARALKKIEPLPPLSWREPLGLMGMPLGALAGQGLHRTVGCLLHLWDVRGRDKDGWVTLSVSELARLEESAATGIRPGSGARSARRRHEAALERLSDHDALRPAIDYPLVESMDDTTRPNLGRAGYPVHGAIAPREGAAIDAALAPPSELPARQVKLNGTVAACLHEGNPSLTAVGDLRILCGLTTSAGRAAYRALLYLQRRGAHGVLVEEFAQMTGLTTSSSSPSYLKRVFGTGWQQLEAAGILRSQPTVSRNEYGGLWLALDFNPLPQSTLILPEQLESFVRIATSMGAIRAPIVDALRRLPDFAVGEYRLGLAVEHLLARARQVKALPGNPGGWIYRALTLDAATFDKWSSDWQKLDGDPVTSRTFHKVADRFRPSHDAPDSLGARSTDDDPPFPL